MNYKFQCDQKVKIMSYCGADDGVEGLIINRYTSDKENHPYIPHNRYGIYITDSKYNYKFDDVSENELQAI